MHQCAGQPADRQFHNEKGLLTDQKSAGSPYFWPFSVLVTWKGLFLCIKDSVLIDPCMGSGHILVYCFDVLMQIYESQGYAQRDAAQSILENNLFGLDIDKRAAQLAYFAVMMKARQYDRRIFNREINPHVYAIGESNHVDKFAAEYFCNGDVKLKAAMDTMISELHDAKEYGSILTVTPQDWSALYARFAEISKDIHMSRDTALAELLTAYIGSMETRSPQERFWICCICAGI